MSDLHDFVEIDGRRLRGALRPVGDKSITHRALLLNSIAKGEATISGGNPGQDPRSTASCLRGLGVDITETAGGCWRVQARGARLHPAVDRLDCGNSGTTMRLLAGICAAQPFTTTLDGDQSLRGRPMARIAKPLRALGARFEGPTNAERPPLVITGPIRRGGRVELEVASAQVKSALLLAAVGANLPDAIEIREPGASRDHTERMLVTMGAPLEWGPGWVRLAPGAALRCIDVEVPGDPSAAALLGGVAAVIPGSRVEFQSTLANPTRTGFVGVLESMGVSTRWESTLTVAGDSVGTLVIEAGDVIRPVQVGPEGVASLIDEVPALAAVAAFGKGTTRFDGIAELRVKESDRIESMQALLAAFGVETTAAPSSIEVHGGAPRRPDARWSGSDDHRIAMAAVVLAAGVCARDGGPALPIDLGVAAVSHPGFAQDLEMLRDNG